MFSDTGISKTTFLTQHRHYHTMQVNGTMNGLNFCAENVKTLWEQLDLLGDALVLIEGQMMN